jgi:hypothetical protein
MTLVTGHTEDGKVVERGNAEVIIHVDASTGTARLDGGPALAPATAARLPVMRRCNCCSTTGQATACTSAAPTASPPMLRSGRSPRGMENGANSRAARTPAT